MRQTLVLHGYGCGCGYGLMLLLLQLQSHIAVAELRTLDTLDTLAMALLQVLQQSEMAACKTLYVHVEYSRLSVQPQLLELLTRVLNMLPATSQPRYVFSQRAMEYRPYRHAVLLLLDDLDALRRVYSRLNATSNLSYTLIYMLQPQPTAVMQLLWERSVLNAALLLLPGDRTRNQRLPLLSYFPFSEGRECQRTRASVVNQFDVSLGRWAKAVHFPAKLRNFYGCTLTCATWPDMPYLVRRPDGTFLGIEGELLQFMANNLNFTLGLYWLSQSQVRDTFNESGWIFEQIFSNSADYALGGFHYKPSNGSTGSEVTYSQSMQYFMSHIMLVTNLPSAYSAYEKLAFPFHPLLWQAIGLLLALSCLLLWLIQRCWKRKLRHPYYNLLVLGIGGNLMSWELPGRNSQRLLLVTWMLWAFVMRNAYQSGMYQLLRQDTQRNPPQTIAEVLAEDYTIQLVDGNAERLLESLPELRTRQLRYLDQSELQSFPGLAACSGTSQRLAIITPYEYFGYFRKVDAMSRQLHVVRERIYTQQLSFNVRRHSYLIGMLNDQIMLAHSHGFLEHWTRRYVSSLDARDESLSHLQAMDGIQAEAESSDFSTSEEAPVKLRVLSLKELAALFWLTVWALLGATFVFILELLIHKKRNGRSELN